VLFGLWKCGLASLAANRALLLRCLCAALLASFFMPVVCAGEEAVGARLAAAKTSTNRLPALLQSELFMRFHLAEVLPRRFSTEYTYTNQSNLVKLEVIQDLDADAAQTIIKDGIMGIEALYANALSPYPGDISKEIVSDNRYRPKLAEKQRRHHTYRYFLLFANERFGYGVTTPDVIKYKSLAGWLYCEAERCLYKIRYFVPAAADKDDRETLFLSCTCP
jgi:hypothetical protein